jgi:hypothetical protein
MFWLVTIRQDATVHIGVQRDNAVIKNRIKSCEFSDISDVDACISQCLRSASA